MRAVMLRPRPEAEPRSLDTKGLLTAALLLATLVAALTVPVLAVPLILAGVAAPLRSPRVLSACATVSLVGVFAWMNAGKRIDGDWVWYTRHYMMLQHLTLGDYLGHRFGVIEIKSTEPIYYTFAYVVSRVTHGSVPALACAVTIVIYGLLGLALSSLRPISSRASVAAAATLVALASGVTFTITTQLVRQEIAGAFVLLGAVYCWRRRYITGIPLLACGALTHNSAAVLALVVLISSVVKASTIARKTVWVSTAAAMFTAGVIWSHVVSADGDYGTRSDGRIANSIFILDAAIFAVFLLSQARCAPVGHLWECARRAVLLYVGFLLGVSTLPIPFLRMYFYVEDLRVLMIGCIVAAWADGKYYVLKIAGFVIVAGLYLQLRLNHSPFDYGGGLYSHLLRPLI